MISKNLKQVHDDVDLEFVDHVCSSFRAWGNEMGASSQALDRELRFNKSLRDQTVDILAVLHDALQEGLWTVNFYFYPADLVRILGTDVMQAESSVGDDADTSGVEDEEDVDPLNTARPNVSSDVAAEVSDIFEDVNYSLGQLVSLSSELREAYPLDLDVRSNASSAAARGVSTDGSPRDFIEMAKRLFPGSSPVLTERLGRASWKRHLSMRLLRDKKSAAIATRLETYKLGPKRAPRYDVAVDAFNFQQPGLRKGSDPSPPSIPRIEKTSSDLSRPEGSESEEEEDGEPLTSMQSSVFSRPLTSRATSHTSYAPSLAQLSYAPVSRKEHELDVLSVPPPPRPLDGQPFLCPYCGFDLNLDKRIDTVDRWEEHVFEDLFAYLCTFDDCNWPRKTYGARHEWHLHELRNHIVPRVWSCASCKEALVLSSSPS
ncbi:hypothetical protein Cob_v001985 [Colletotrichum orbiculare MAFF 240422]|uniref:Oxidoreductase acuF-like C2H2 type zinc-finger domain-containing protein n=1 Tax=Colletotrichum orbiculare (strain 104-T / ATCC 96160 / CBS 514.97 / LARS 414 / MAFF 240422) TaxID=1213857 RepID=A0A484G5Z4_COLOR|nr:hypothetical protein Cob_v001985 [Colletotrichum orbiculare MAFF 240422]